MPCYSPLQAWRGPKLPTGKRSVVWKRKDAASSLVDAELRLPCGQCIGCRLERSRQWAMRCVHEASLHKRNCFVTLTYDDPHLPAGGGLSLRDWQLFMKKLRKYAGRCKVRFFMCGEYGEKFCRPHFHACLFNWDFADKVLWSVRDGVRLYRSPRLEKLWGNGFCSVGDVTFESAAYVARYIMKKVTGAGAPDRYDVFDRKTGEVFQESRPEFVTMSRRPGIARGWFEKFSLDTYPSDFVVLRGMKMKPPRFYDGIYDVVDPAGMAGVKARRNSRAFSLRGENGDYELRCKEVNKLAQVSRLSRGLEAGI